MDLDRFIKPKIIYKYFPVSDDAKRCVWNEGFFLDGKLCFSNPLTFNDPFDSYEFRVKAVDIEEFHKKVDDLIAKAERYEKSPDAMERLVEMLGGNPNDLKYNVLYLKGLKKIGPNGPLLGSRTLYKFYKVCCFSKHRDDILLWSHYGQSHKGFCLGFRIDSPFFYNLKPIIYENDRPEVEWEDVLNVENQANCGILRYYVKAQNWSYEKEYRLARFIENENERDKDYMLEAIPPAAINEVIFGCRMDDRERKKIIRLLKSKDSIFNAEINNISFLQAKTHKDNYRLTLEKCGA